METINTPEKITKKISGKIIRTFQVDYTGDGINDYICQLESTDNTKDIFVEIWLNSDLEIIKTIEKYSMDYDFFWFVNLDIYPEPEIFRASGYSDGIDYCFIDQNLKTGKDNVLFYFNPIIINSGNLFWGYPWDISNICIKQTNSLLEIKCSTSHDITRDEEFIIADWQKSPPVIYFYGHTTQPYSQITPIKKYEWLTIPEIISKIK